MEEALVVQMYVTILLQMQKRKGLQWCVELFCNNLVSLTVYCVVEKFFTIDFPFKYPFVIQLSFQAPY